MTHEFFFAIFYFFQIFIFRISRCHHEIRLKFDGVINIFLFSPLISLDPSEGKLNTIPRAIINVIKANQKLFSLATCASNNQNKLPPTSTNSSKFFTKINAKYKHITIRAYEIRQQ